MLKTALAVARIGLALFALGLVTAGSVYGVPVMMVLGVLLCWSAWRI